jgi:hypothetical protein
MNASFDLCRADTATRQPVIDGRNSPAEPTGQEKAMFTTPARQGTPPRMPARKVGARLRRFAAVLAAVTSGLLASVAIVPAAFARMEPDPGAGYVSTRVARVPATTVRVVTAGGMPGWQITVIALGAALLAATAAVLLYRALAARRSAPVTA